MLLDLLYALGERDNLAVVIRAPNVRLGIEGGGLYPLQLVETYTCHPVTEGAKWQLHAVTEP
jgi:hypothetical protein